MDLLKSHSLRNSFWTAIGCTQPRSHCNDCMASISRFFESSQIGVSGIYLMHLVDLEEVWWRECWKVEMELIREIRKMFMVDKEEFDKNRTYQVSSYNGHDGHDSKNQRHFSPWNERTKQETDKIAGCR